MSQWEFFVTDLAGKIIAPIVNAYDRKVDLPLKRIPTASFRVRLDHPYADEFLAMDRLIQGYRTDAPGGTRNLVFQGPILSTEETADASTKSMQVNAVGPLWRLNKRFAGKTAAGQPYHGTLSAIAASILNAANIEGHTGITVGTAQDDGVTYDIGPVFFKPVGEAIAEMGTTAVGYEFEVAPVAPSGAFPNTVIGNLNMFYPRIGADKPDAIFEYGTSKANVLSYSRTLSYDGLLTKGWNFNSDYSSILSQTDSTAVAARGLYEDIIQSDIIDAPARQQLVNEHVTVRKQARLMVNFTPVRDATPRIFNDYIVGDTIRFRVMNGTATRLDVNLRVWGATFDIDPNGAETVSLELASP